MCYLYEAGAIVARILFTKTFHVILASNATLKRRWTVIKHKYSTNKCTLIIIIIIYILYIIIPVIPNNNNYNKSAFVG
jgi:hypothetical protein